MNGSQIHTATTGIDAENTSGNWAVHNTTITDLNDGDPEAEDTAPSDGTAIYAARTDGDWLVRTSLLDTSLHGINATNAAITGDASHNYWGASDGPSGAFFGSGSQATGNVIVSPFYTDAELTTLETIDDGSEFVDLNASDLQGNGTDTDPYIITNASELQAMEDDLSAHYELGRNINASGTAQWHNGSGFSPVGTEAGPRFNGSFDGEEYAVTGLTINRSTDNVGLFGYIGSAGEIRDASLTGVQITGGEFSVGGLAGVNDGRVTDAVANGSVNGTEEVGGLVGRNSGTIYESAARTTVYGTVNIGGVTGRNEGSVSRSLSESAVDGSQNVGGLVGNNLQNATLRTSVARGTTNGSDHVGGLVGLNNGAEISNASARGQVNGSDSIGGLVGLNNDATVVDTFATGSVSGSTSVGGLIGTNASSTVRDSYWDTAATDQATSAGAATGLTTVEMTGTAARTNMSGLAFGTVWETRSDDYPVFAFQRDDEAEPVVNATDTAVTPQSVAANSSEQFAVEFTVEDTGLTAESGEVDVAFEGLELETGEEDLTISYTEANLSDGSLHVSGSVTATAPESTGFYAVNVTDLRVENDEPLIQDANIRVGTVEVTETTGAGIQYAATGRTSVWSSGENRLTSELLHIEGANETFEIGPNRSFRLTSTETGRSVTVTPESDTATYSATTAELLIYNPSGTLRVQPELGLTVDNSYVETNVSVEGDRGMFENESLFSSYTVELLDDGGNVLGETEPAPHGIAYPGSLRQNATSGSIEVSLNRSGAVNESWAVEYTISNSTGPIYSTPVRNNVSDETFTATVDADTLADGSYTHRFSIRPSADAASGDRILGVRAVDDLVVESDDTSSGGGGSGGSGADPVVNTSISSVTPTTVTANETQSYDFDLVVENTSLTTESGTINVSASGINDTLTLGYNGSNISNGTIFVEESVTATAPETTGEYDVNVTGLRVADTGEKLLTDTTITFETVTVTERPDPVVNTSVSVVTPQSVPANESEQFEVDIRIDNTTLTTASGEVDVAFEAFDLDLADDELDDTEYEDLSIDYTEANLSEGTLTVSESVTATAPASTGDYAVTVTDLRIEGTDDPDSSLIEDANITVDRIDVTASRPTLANDSYRLNAGETITVSAPGVLGNDTDPNGDTLTASVARGPANGSLTLFSNGSFEYTPDDGFTGTDQFSYRATDPTGNADTAQVTLTVTDAAVESLSATVDEETIPNGTTTSLTATATFTNGSTQDVTAAAGIQAGQAGVVDINGTTGEITGLQEGSTGLNVFYNDATTTTNVTVSRAVPASLDVSLAETTIDSDETTSLTATARLTNNTTRDVTNVANITSSDTSVVSVDNGTVSGVRAGGPVALTASLGEATDSSDIVVAVPPLTVNQSAIEFGTVSLGAESRTTLTVRNNASTNISVDGAELLGADAGSFAITEPTLPESVPANSNVSVEVRFAPTTRGTATGTFGIADSTVALTGTGVAPGINVTSELPAEATAQQGDSTTAAVTISNDGNAPLNASLTTADDAFDQPASLDIPANASTTVELTFSPDSTDTGTLSTDLVIASDNAAVSVPVAGTVIEREVDLRQSDIEFGTTTVGETATSAVVVDNTGTTTENLTVSTTNESRFNISDAADRTITLGGGDSERLAINATLNSSGSVTETLRVENESATVVSDTATLNATAEAPQLTVLNDSVGFSETPVNSTSTAEVEIRNDGEAELRVTLDEAFNTSEAEQFSVVGATDIGIPANETRTITVGFRPQATGESTANLTLATNDIGATAAAENVSLTATGSDTDLQITEDIPSFGAVGVGASESRTLTIENNGTSTLRFDETVTPASEFTVDSVPEELPGGETASVTVTFTPTANGTQTGSLQLTAEADTGNTTNISTSLAGTGRYGALSISQQTLRTGVTTTTGTTTGTVTADNAGLNGTTVTVDEITVADSGNFSVNATAGLAAGDVLASGEPTPLAVTFAPASAADNGEQTTTLRLNASSGERTFSRELTVTGVVSTPEPTVSPGDLQLGTVTVGDERFETVTVSNDGGEPFSITDVSADESRVEARQEGPSEIVPGGESRVVVAVNRTETGAIDSTVTINTTDEDLTVDLTGTAVAPELDLSAENIEFTDTAVGSASQGALTVRNTGNASLTVAQPTITGTDNGSFRLLSGDRQLRIAAGGSQTLTVGFGPEATGMANATLLVESVDDPTDTETRRISLSGTGTDADAALNNSAVSFGDVEVEETRSQRLTLTNDGNASLAVSDASLVGADAGAFNVTGLSETTLGAGESQQFTVELNTTGADRGQLGSQLVISTNDTDVTSQLGATVVAPDIEIASAVDADQFGTTRLGTTSTATVTVNNTGNAELNLTNLAVDGSDADAFSIVDTPDNTTVDPQDTGQLVIEFDPAAAPSAVSRAQNTPLAAAATLNVSSDDPDASQQHRSLTLNAEGVTGAIETPRTYQFGDVQLGSTASGQLTVENSPSATASLNITRIAITGPDAGDYAASLNGTDTPASLAAGETATVDVSLSPSSFGQKYATLSVYTNDSRQPVQKIGLSNTETTYSVDYGSVNVTYRNPTVGAEPTVNVDEGLRGRNATLRAVNSNVSSTADYSLNYTFGSSPSAVGHDTALQTDDVTGTNLTSLRYINATTSATDGEFEESTFQVEVSKAALARQDVTPENVSIYHETDSGYERLNSTELLFETTQGYVYETTTDSYSVFAVGAPDRQTVDSLEISLDETTVTEGDSTTVSVSATYDDGSTADVTSEADITSGASLATVSGTTVETSSAGSATIEATFEGQTASVELTVESDESGGSNDDGSPSSSFSDGPTDDSEESEDETDEEATDDAEETSIADVVAQVAAETPETTVEAEIADSDPEREGVTVETEGTETVRQVTFADEGVSGTVSVTEYGQPSADLAATIEQSVAADIAASESTDDSASGDDSTTQSVSIRSVTDISPSSDAATETAATVELTVDRETLDTPANAFVAHETDDGWERLETTVEETSSGEVTLSADTDSFSLFAVAESRPSSQSDPATTDDAADESTSDTDDSGGSAPVLPIVGVLLVVSLLGAALWVGRQE